MSDKENKTDMGLNGVESDDQMQNKSEMVTADSMEKNDTLDDFATKGKTKGSIKSLFKNKVFLSVIIVVVVILVAVIVIVCVKNANSESSQGNVAPSETQTQGIEEVSAIVNSENQEYIDKMENKPQTDMQKAALNSAIEYSKYSAMSYNSIVSQLESDGQSHEDAVYAADNCGADWNEIAVRATVRYIDSEPSSRTRMIDILIADGFTEEQANFAADNSGIDYVEQAKKSALVYLSVENYEKNTLIEFLVGVEGYTQEQAVAGVDLALAS